MIKKYIDSFINWINKYVDICIVELTKYVPIVISVYIVLVGISVLKGFYIPFFTYGFIGIISIGGIISEIYFLLMSWKLKFCYYHQLLIINLIFTTFIQYLQDNGLNVNYDIYFAIIPITITLFMLSINNYFNGWNKK